MDNILKPVLIAVIIILAVLIIWKANRFTTADQPENKSSAGIQEAVSGKTVFYSAGIFHRVSGQTRAGDTLSVHHRQPQRQRFNYY